MSNTVVFKCPSCSQPLNKEGKSYRCQNNHTYDEAKEGYVNLLLAQHKKSKNPGDNDEMIKSRQAFLNKEYYKLLSSSIVKLIAQRGFEQSVLDVGCGEGYYMHELVKADKDEKLSLSGIDISKTAVKLAGKRKMNALLAVASAYDLPFFDQSFNTIVSVFSPVSDSEIERLLKSNGKIIMVGPAPKHLNGLTAHIYDEVLPHKGNYSVLDYNAPQNQDQALVKLTKELMQTYNIPASHVSGHGYTKGEHTKCPGKNFPMQQFLKDIQ